MLKPGPLRWRGLLQAWRYFSQVIKYSILSHYHRAYRYSNHSYFTLHRGNPGVIPHARVQLRYFCWNQLLHWRRRWRWGWTQGTGGATLSRCTHTGDSYKPCWAVAVLVCATWYMLVFCILSRCTHTGDSVASYKPDWAQTGKGMVTVFVTVLVCVTWRETHIQDTS